MFVLLEHDTGAGVHWDFMLAIADQEKLATWRLLQNPLEHPTGVAAERIGDHRRIYLDYEGDIGGGRGQVRRLDRGAAAVEIFTEREARLNLEGTCLRGRFLIFRRDDGVWIFQAAP